MDGVRLRSLCVGWVAGSVETKDISASNLKLKLTEAELGKIRFQFQFQMIFAHISPINQQHLKRRKVDKWLL